MIRNLKIRVKAPFAIVAVTIIGFNNSSHSAHHNVEMKRVLALHGYSSIKTSRISLL